MKLLGLKQFTRRARAAFTAVALLGLAALPARANLIAYFRTIYDTDFTSAGVGAMRDVGNGTITLTGLTGTVTRAYLYWAGPMNNLNPTANAAVSVNNQTIAGANIGMSQDNCWGYLVGQAYRADVTEIVRAKRNGAYTLKNFLKPGGINVNGASLIVFFNDGKTNNNRDVVLFDGNDANAPNPRDSDGWNVVLPNINYKSGTVRMQLHVSDGQSYLDEALIVNGTTIFPKGAVFSGDTVPGVNNGPGGLGRMWDIRTFPVNAIMTPGQNTLVMTHGYTLGNDCTDLIVAAIDLPAGAAPPPTNQPPTVTCISSISLSNAEPANLEAEVGDPDGDALTYTISVDGVLARSGSIPAGGLVASTQPTLGRLNLTNTFPLGLHVVTFTVSDSKASAMAAMAVTVTDTKAPVITCSSNLVRRTDTGKASASVTYNVPPPTDEFPGVSLICLPPSGSAFPKGTNTVNCTAVDAAGNRSTCSFLITVTDAELPMVNCVSNIVKDLEAGKSNAVVNFTVTASDNVPGVRVACVPPSGSTFALGTTTVNCTANDTSGNAATCAFTVTVRDGTAPELTCPVLPLITIDAPRSNIVVNFSATATDNLPGVNVACVPPSGSVFATGTNLVNCTATDAAGNTDTCRFSVVVKQLPDPCPGCSTNLPPMNFSCPMVIDLRSYLATNLPNFAATCVPPSGSVFPLGTNAITCTYTNARGVVTNFAFTITIADTKAPTLTCPADITIAADPGRTNIAVNFSATGRDDCSAVSLTYSKAPGSIFPMGQTTVIVTGRDSAGNSATCSFNVTVIDNRLYLPTTNLTRNTDAGLCSAVVTYPFGSLPPGHLIVCNPPSGTTFAKGATTVRCTATNPSGRSTNASFTVTVLDKELPVLTVPTNMVISCASKMKSTKRIKKTSTKKDNKRDDTDDDQDGEKDDNRVTWTTTATDNCPGVSVVCVPASGSIFTNGTTVVRCTATDASSNQATASFQVKLTDLTPPVITSLKASPSNLWPPNHKMVAVKLTVKATDACGPVTSRIVSVSSNQPLNGTGDGNTDIDWAITGPLTVNLRAERAGNAVRIYTIIVESKDAAGNTTTRSAQVYVDHNKSTSDTTTDKSKDSPPVNQLMK